MISKEKFVEIVERLRNYDDMRKEIESIQDKYIEPRENDFTNAFGICVGHETVVVELLEDIFKDENEILSWWLWELDYGRKFQIGYLIDERGKKINITTPEKLYDYLIKEMKENDENI